MYHNGHLVWYAVCVDDDTDHGTGSHNKKEALKLARRYARAYPDQRITIVTVDPDDDFCLNVEVIQ